VSTFNPATEAALQADVPLIAGLLKIQLPDATIRLLDGAATIDYGGEIYVGRDATFGVLAAVDRISDGVGDEAPAIRITLHPADDAAAAELSGPLMQGSSVWLWLAAIARTTGAIIGDPLLIFSGELDQPTLTVGKGKRELQYDCVSSMERLFDNQEGVRLADSWHQQVWPGELGLANMTGIIKTIYWGVHAPSNAIAIAPNTFVGAAAAALGFSFPANGASA
jgi:hypothetical protein